MKESLRFTITALFLLVASCTPAGSPQPTSTPKSTATPLPTPTSTPIPTATPQPPVAIVGGKLHCFDESSMEAEVVTIIDIGMQVEVAGRSQDSIFWLVKPEEEAGPCWLEARYATVINLDNQEIARIQPSPTATLTIPQAPENFRVEGGCYPFYRGRSLKYYDVMFILKWEPVDRISGYTVYKNGQVLANLDGSEIEYSDWFKLKRKQSDVVIYSIQAHNEVGNSELVEFSANYICIKP